MTKLESNLLMTTVHYMKLTTSHYDMHNKVRRRSLFKIKLNAKGLFVSASPFRRYKFFKV
jgi:hypothetical protein